MGAHRPHTSYEIAEVLCLGQSGKTKRMNSNIEEEISFQVDNQDCYFVERLLKHLNGEAKHGEDHGKNLEFLSKQELWPIFFINKNEETGN